TPPTSRVRAYGVVLEGPSLGSRLHLDRRLSFQLAPANHGAVDRRCHRLDHHVVHHLAIAEALQEQPPEQTPALFAFQQESKTRSAPIDSQKQCVIKKHLL